jgi:predicted cupin superfamily sugar epimerase
MAGQTLDFRDPLLTAAQIRVALELKPHPEGGWFRETWRDVPDQPGHRGAATAILFLLGEGEESAWHRVDAAEIWLFHAGAPLQLRIAKDRASWTLALGPVRAADAVTENFQAVVPAGCWQAARSTGAWSLVSCVVAPAFTFAGFELAPKGGPPGLR